MLMVNAANPSDREHFISPDSSLSVTDKLKMALIGVFFKCCS